MGFLDDAIGRKKPAVEPVEPVQPRSVSPEPEAHTVALAQHMVGLITHTSVEGTPPVPDTPPEEVTPNPPGITTPAPNTISVSGAYEAGLPKIAYSEAEFLKILERSKKATTFMLDQAMGPKGDAKMDDFIEVIENLYGMAVAYRTVKILNAD